MTNSGNTWETDGYCITVLIISTQMSKAYVHKTFSVSLFTDNLDLEELCNTFFGNSYSIFDFSQPLYSCSTDLKETIVQFISVRCILKRRRKNDELLFLNAYTMCMLSREIFCQTLLGYRMNPAAL